MDLWVLYVVGIVWRRVSPPRESTGSRVDDVFRLGPGEAVVEGHVERERDIVISNGRGFYRRAFVEVGHVSCV
jgi:hypothetical protein